MAAVAAIAAVAGSILGYVGKEQAANATLARAREQQQLANRQAIQAEASGQQAGFDQERRAKLLASRALYISAASGNAGDPMATRLIGDIMGEGAYRRGLVVYDAEERAQLMREEGSADVATANDQAGALRLSAAGDLISGAGSLYSKYGGGGPRGDG